MIACMASASSGRARRSTNRSVRISSIMAARHRLLENRLKHGRVESSGVLVVAAAVIAIDQRSPPGQFKLGAMGEFGAGERDLEAAAQAVVGDLTKGDEGA